MTLLIDLHRRRSGQKTNLIEQTTNKITLFTPQVREQTSLKPASYKAYKRQTLLEVVFDSCPPLDKGWPYPVQEMSSLEIQWRKYRLFARFDSTDASVRDKLAF